MVRLYDYKEMEMIVRKTNVLYIFILSFLILFVPKSFGGEVTDEFSAAQLNGSIWEVKQVGNASYKINDGKLTLTSPKPTDGIILYYNQEVNQPGFSFEVKVDSSGIVDSGYVTTTKTMTPPEVSNTYNALRLGQFRLKSAGWLVRDENIQEVVNGNIQGGMHTYKIEIGKDTLSFHFDEGKVAEIPTVAETRFFSVSPDPYSTDYSGEVVIEYIKISAPWIVAVEPAGRLTTFWGSIK
ncbi:MAG: hypothetical protein QG588_1553 [Candidatus Poribacteria bacterium]|nr:hypothetical protein [Candidatus Poribacteria bacterium]